MRKMTLALALSGVLAVGLAGCPGKTDKTDAKTDAKTSAEAEKPDILGKWEAKRGDDVLGFEFAADGKAKVSENGKAEDGEMTYKFDSSKDPMHLDIFVKVEGKDTPLMTGIARFEGKKLKYFAAGDGDTERPKDFGEDTLLFEKK